MTNSWIKVHSGLITQEHIQRLGKLLPYFLYLLNRTHWTTGVVFLYKDKQAADFFDVDIKTVRRWRKALAEYYITAEPDFQGQRIVIHRWRNPKLVNPPQMNVPGEPDTWWTKMSTHPTSEMSTLTYSIHITDDESLEGFIQF